MTDNDTPPTSSYGQWVFIDPHKPQTTSQEVSTTLQPTAVQSTVTRMRAVEDIPPTTGIILDQKVLIPLILLLGAVAGIILMLLLDKYFSPSRPVRARAERDEPRVTLEYTE